jgi:hypothetical protein
MRDSRAGECLWQEWTGDGHDATTSSSLLFFTNEHVDLEHDVVRRALASALQRDGSVVSLGKGFAALETATVTQGYAGHVNEELELTVCDEHGETYYGDAVDEVFAVTWVAIQ